MPLSFNVNDDLTDNATLKCLDEPVALFFTYVDEAQYMFYLKNRQELINIHSTCRDDLVQYLQQHQYPAVNNLNPLAAHPGSIVVSSTGIQTPFLAAKQAREFAKNLIKIIDLSGFAKPMSYVLGVRICQMPPPVLHDRPQPEKFKYLNPDRHIHEYVAFRYGKNFEERMYKVAWDQGEDTEAWFKANDLSNQLHTGRKYLKEKESTQARNNIASRQVLLGTNYKNAARYAKEKGFIDHFSMSEDQEMYDDYAVEMGLKREYHRERQLEGIIVPGKNAYLGGEIFMGTRRFDIPQDVEEWEAFQELHRAIYAPSSQHLEQRRINQLKEAKNNGGQAKTYNPLRTKISDLLLENYPVEKIELEDVLLSEPTKLRQKFQAWLNETIKKVKNIKQSTVQSTSSQENISINTLMPKIKTYNDK